MMGKTCNLQPETTCDWIESTRFGIVVNKIQPTLFLWYSFRAWQVAETTTSSGFDGINISHITLIFFCKIE